MKKTILTCAAVSIMLFACKKDETTPISSTPVSINDDVASSEDDALAESLFESTQGIIDEGLEETDNSSLRKLLKRPGNCADADITIDVAKNTATVVYTFKGETCDDGQVRSGTITLVANKKNFRESGAILTMTFSNYKVDGIQIDAKRVLTNKKAIDGTTGRNQTIKVTGADGTGSATITKADGTKIMWNAEKTREQTAGADTRSKFDDKFKISGTQGGTSSKGHVYSTTIADTTPVIIDNSCLKYRAVSGIRTVTRGDKTFTINYGDGTCDNKTVVTDSEGKVHTVTVGKTGTIPTSTGNVSTDTNSISGADVKTAITAASVDVPKNASGDVTTIVKNTDGTVTKTIDVKKGTVTDEIWTTIIYPTGITYTKIEEPGKTNPLQIKGFLTKDGSIIGKSEKDGIVLNIVIKADNSAAGSQTKDGITFTFVRNADGSTIDTETKAGIKTSVSVKGTNGIKVETKYEANGTTIKSITTELTDGTKTTVDKDGKPITTGTSLTLGTFSIDGIVYTKKGGSNSSEGSDEKGTGRTTSYYQTGTNVYCMIIFGNRARKNGTYKVNATEIYGTNLASDEVFITVKDSNGKMHIAQSGSLEIKPDKFISGQYTFDVVSLNFKDITTESGKISAYLSVD